MTQQLADARAEANRSMGQLDAARGNLQTILDNLTSGVIVLDARGAIVLSNPGATRILRAPMAVHEGRALSQVPGLEQFGEVVQEQFALFLGEQGRDRWQLVHELHASTDGGVIQHTTTLVMRGAELPDAQRLLVFDDISGSSRPSAPRPGARWRAAWPMRSRTRSRPSSCRPSAWPCG